MKLRDQKSEKIIMPDNELVGVKKSENKSEKKEEPKLPKPTGWRMLVLPFKMKDKTKGGLLLAEDTLERQQVASQVGLVLAMGPDCYKDKERYPDGPWCKVNDWVMFPTCRCPSSWCRHRKRRVDRWRVRCCRPRSVGGRSGRRCAQHALRGQP